ncbi:transposase [bacterium]|nr:transposase [bacterium]
MAVSAGSSGDGDSWLALLRGLRKRGVRGVDLIVADAHAGLREARPPDIQGLDALAREPGPHAIRS